MAASNDDALFQIAVHESVQSNTAEAGSGQSKPAGQVVGEETERDFYPRITIDDMIGRLVSRATAELPGFDDPEGDTWIFIDAAPKQPEQDQVDYEHYVKRCSAPIRLKKTTLMKLDSPIINSAFGPTSQYRLLRRRKLVDRLPQGIKHVIDLTPPNEGEDAVWLISSLSCSEGVRWWHQSQEVFGVSPQLVGGTEEYTSFQPNTDTAQLVSSTKSQTTTNHSPIAPEYSPLRHRAAIERLLAAAAGADPKLDSAPKLWTTFAVARNFGIVRSSLTDYIVTWLRANPNCMFLEVLTEASHIMADQLEVYDLERDTFSMLVGEEALDSMVRSRDSQAHPSVSTFGRKKEDLPEHIQTRVEYASKALTDRISADFEELKSGRWIESLAEVQRLSSFTHPKFQDAIAELRMRLVEWVQGTILHVQCANYASIPTPDIPPFGGEDLILRRDRTTVFNSLNPSERILTRTFWNALETLNLFGGITNVDIVPGWDKTAILATVIRKTHKPDWARDGYHILRRSSIQWIIDIGEDILEELELHNPQTIEQLDIEHFSTHLASSSFVPLEVANRTPLAIRPKVEWNSVPVMRNRDPVAKEGNFGEDNVRPMASISESNWPAPEGLAERATQQPSTRSSDHSDPSSLNLLKTIETPDQQPLVEKENTFLDEENALADWGESLQGYFLKGEDEYEAADTSPLLDTNKLFHSHDVFSRKHDIDEKQGTKRPAENLQAEPHTTATTVPGILEQISSKRAKAPNTPVFDRPVFFRLSRFFDQAEQHIRMIARLKLSYTDVLNGRNDPHKVELINTLVCLDDPEFKYLPLWAGGCDDDSGGVFNDEVAIPDVSFATAGPSIHHGAAMHTVSECDTVSDNGLPRRGGGIATPTSSVPSSEYHMVNNTTSTIAPSSNRTTAGYFSDKLNSDQVYAADSIDGSSISNDDDFSVVARSEGIDPDDEEEHARREIERMERLEAAEAEEAAAAARLARKARREPADDENYADLFGSEEGDEDDEDWNGNGNESDDTLQGPDDDDDDDDEGELI